MPWTGQTFARLKTWVGDRNAGVKILADLHDTHDNDLATGITTCLRKDGGNAATANIPLGGFKTTGGGTATALGDGVSLVNKGDGTPTLPAVDGSTLTGVATADGSVTFPKLAAAAVATEAQAEAGTDAATLMTPLQTAQAITAQRGFADQATAEAATDAAKVMSPLTVGQQITARIATQAEAEAGLGNTKLMTPLRSAELITATIGSGSYFVSPTAHAFSGTGAGGTSDTHGLGVQPIMVKASLLCTSTDLGFSAGDEVDFASADSGGSNDTVTLWANSTVVGVSWKTAPAILNKGAGGTQGTIDTTKWKVVLRAWTTLAYAVGSGDASLVSVTPAGSIASTDVQSALEELDTDIAAKQDALSPVPVVTYLSDGTGLTGYTLPGIYQITGAATVARTTGLQPGAVSFYDLDSSEYTAGAYTVRATDMGQYVVLPKGVTLNITLPNGLSANNMGRSGLTGKFFGDMNFISFEIFAGASVALTITFTRGSGCTLYGDTGVNVSSFTVTVAVNARTAVSFVNRGSNWALVS